MKTALFMLINKIISKAGVVMIPVRELGNRTHLEDNFGLLEHDLLRLKEASNGGGLRQHLLKNNMTRWLEIGCGGTLEDNFHYIDVFPEGIVDPRARNHYSRLDIVHATTRDLEAMGKFDLIRMQHVFEHFIPEDGEQVLKKCGSLLKPGGYILISTPDLQIHARTYLSSGYKNNPHMKSWNESFAYQRIPEDAPDSFHFSVFAHSLTYERHLWCYDFDGLRYILNKTGLFGDIEELKIDHPFATFPFTHNRPDEDVCVLARRK